jgi:hypothetical protein
MDLEETEAFNASTEKASVTSMSIVMSHSVEALKAFVSSRSIVMSHSVDALKASVFSKSIVLITMDLEKTEAFNASTE